MNGKIHKDFITLLKEGLILTHDINRQEDTLSLRLDSCGISHRIEIYSKFVFFVTYLVSVETGWRRSSSLVTGSKVYLDISRPTSG